MHDDYEIIKKIGQGRYSAVYEGYNVVKEEKVVVKILKPVNQRRIKREVKILQNLQGGPNIVKFHELIVDYGSKTPSLIYEHLDVVDWRGLYQNLVDNEIRFYFFQILRVNFNIIKGVRLQSYDGNNA
jgi:casein kinase II subunit alpha